MTTNWLPESILNTTVLIEKKTIQFGEKVSKPLGTGFLIDYKSKNFMVTCKHVIEEMKDENIIVIFQKKDGTTSNQPINYINDAGFEWIFHKFQDIAIIGFPIDQQKDDLLKLPENLFESFKDIRVGEDIFFLGHPIFLREILNNNGLTIHRDLSKEISPKKPLVRAGIISSKNDNEDKIFLIEGNVFKGSSGSPVFYKPTLINMETQTIGERRGIKLLGMVDSYMLHSDYAVSQETGELRVVFQENAGIAEVISVEKIKEIFDYDEFKKMYFPGENNNEKEKE